MGSQNVGNIDPTLRVLKKLGRYQLLQLVFIYLGSLGGAYQRLCNVFVGRQVTSFQCAAPDNESAVPSELTEFSWNGSYVTFGQCEITVSKDNLSGVSEQFPCPYGYEYGFRRELSFRTEFDLVCDRQLLGGLAQTFVFIGQGVGAIIASALSDRFGRKLVLVLSQLGLLVFGVAAGFAPSYPVFAFLKFLLGAFQQGVIAAGASMSLELLPAETRSINYLLAPVLFGACSASMSLLAFLLQDYSWRYLQFAVSAASLVAFAQWWYVDESLRWLVANGRKEATLTVLQRAARVNRVDLTHVIKTLEASATHQETEKLNKEEQPDEDIPSNGKPSPDMDSELVRSLEEKQTQKLTLLDIFTHRRLLCNAVIMSFAWFSCAFAYFALYMMSTTLHGNPYLNYFFTAMMEMVPGMSNYLLVDRIGRKWATRPMYAIAGVGLICSGLFREYAATTALETLSVVFAMLGMVGASAMFNAIAFFTPELFPTNLRTQALGVASFAGRLGAMLSPYMTDLAEIAVWGPGALIGSLCFLVVIVMHFLPETKGRELPNTIRDIELWYEREGKKDADKSERETMNIVR